MMVSHIGIRRTDRPFLPVIRMQPLFGHCHESPGVTTHDGTIVVNCTLGNGGRGALVEIDGDHATARLL
jgi:Icc-related predicted phosphoesterase